MLPRYAMLPYAFAIAAAEPCQRHSAAKERCRHAALRTIERILRFFVADSC